MAGPPTIQNGSNIPLNVQQGTIPNMIEGLTDYFQTMTFTQVVKTNVGFEVLETPTNITFEGVIMPFSERQLLLLPEGERAWTWFWLFAYPVLTLQVDDVVTWNNRTVRVMSRKNYLIYNYVEYRLIEDWRGSGPNP